MELCLTLKIQEIPWGWCDNIGASQYILHFFGHIYCKSLFCQPYDKWPNYMYYCTLYGLLLFIKSFQTAPRCRSWIFDHSRVWRSVVRFEISDKYSDELKLWDYMNKLRRPEFCTVTGLPFRAGLFSFCEIVYMKWDFYGRKWGLDWNGGRTCHFLGRHFTLILLL